MAGSPLLIRVRNRTRRLRQYRWRVGGHRSPEEHIVMGGAPRSGTTVLRRSLDRHPEVCAGPETKLFIPAAFNLEWLAEAYAIPLEDLEGMRRDAVSQGAFIDAFATRVRAQAGKPRWAEKTPMNIRYLDWIMPRFPEATIVHIIRDGRDVVCSMREHPDWRWVDGAWQKVLVPRSIGTYARRWLADTTAGMAWRGDPRYVELRYEDLVADPVHVLRGICDGVGIAPDGAWLETVARSEPDAPSPSAPPDYEGVLNDSSVGRWRRDLDTSEQKELQRLLGGRLEELGYET